MFEKYGELKRRIQAMPPMTERERQAQGLSFAYGNVRLGECETDGKLRPVSRAAFAKHAIEVYGWTPEEFAVWALDREWA